MLITNTYILWNNITNSYGGKYGIKSLKVFY